jgi:tetratricopeptide (TPR) repeat protein
VRDLLRQVLDVLVLASAVCGLLLFAAAVIGFIAALVRVTILGRVLVIPFRGSDERRVEITGLFARRLMEIEGTCTRRAREIKHLKAEFEKQSRRTLVADHGDDVLAGNGELSDAVTDLSRFRDLPTIGPAPRVGDEFIDDILLLDERASIADADLGVVSVAGVSFSPQSILALLRAVPAVFARRLLTGSIVNFGANAVVSVSYEERWATRDSGAVRRRTEVKGDGWMPAIEDLAFALAKGRIEHLRRRGREDHSRQPAPLATRVSEMADRATVEATSWAAGEAFLDGYVSHLRHYVSGKGMDRDRALRCYAAAVQAQPGYTRAIYHRATLLYNQYQPGPNKEAIAGFTEVARSSDDARVRALAYAGLAMAYCQTAHRFGDDREKAANLAGSASEKAIEAEATLEEAGVADAWTKQVREQFEAAVARYDEVADRAGPAAPAQRIASFALNNAGWIWLNPLQERDDSLGHAERRLWQAVRLYPNKVAYANLAEVARRHRRYAAASALFECSLTLDTSYVKGWNERACLEVEIAATGAADKRAEALNASKTHHERAIELTDDRHYVEELRNEYKKALESHGLLEQVKVPEVSASLT